MTEQITLLKLDRATDLLNKELGQELKPYKEERAPNGDLIPNPGTYYVVNCNGGYRLERMSKGGGSSNASSRGSKRAVFDHIHAMLQGIRAYKEAQA